MFNRYTQLNCIFVKFLQPNVSHAISLNWYNRILCTILGIEPNTKLSSKFISACGRQLLAYFLFARWFISLRFFTVLRVFGVCRAFFVFLLFYISFLYFMKDYLVVFGSILKFSPCKASWGCRKRAASSWQTKECHRGQERCDARGRILPFLLSPCSMLDSFLYSIRRWLRDSS